MPDPIFELTTHKSMGGRDSHDTFSNSHCVQVNLDIADPGLKNIANQIVEAERAHHVSEVHILRTTIKKIANFGVLEDRKRLAVVEHAGVGLRAVSLALVVGGNAQLVNPLVTDSQCLLVTKQCAEGRAGRSPYRGMLTQDDVEIGLDRKYVLAADGYWGSGAAHAADFATSLSQALPSGGVLVIAAQGDTSQDGRVINAHRVAGVMELQTTKRRRSADQELAEAVKRKILKAYHDALKLLGGKTPAQLIGAAASAFAALKAAAAVDWAALPPAEAIALAAGEEVGAALALLLI